MDILSLRDDGKSGGYCANEGRKDPGRRVGVAAAAGVIGTIET
jgi:hypothetical protein